MSGLLLRSIMIGMAIAAPVGPIGVICIRRTLSFGWLSGFISGLGAATADACYGAVAAMGLTALSLYLISVQDMLRLFGGVFLCYVGVRTLKERPKVVTPEQLTRTLRAPGGPFCWRAGGMDYLSTFLLTITNPMTILSFTAIFVSLGTAASQAGSTFSAFTVVVGVFLGSASWWLCLSGATNLFRMRFLRPEVQLWVTRLSGALILGFGVFAVAAGLRGIFLGRVV